METITYEEMFEWFERQRSKSSDIKDSKIIDALEEEIGYKKNDEVIEDDFDTLEDDLYFLNDSNRGAERAE